MQPSSSQITFFFDEMLRLQASDLHLAPHYPPLLRIRGELHAIAGESPFTAEKLWQALQKILSPQQQIKFFEENDLDFAYAFEDKARFRGNIMRKIHGIGAIFRVIPSKILTLEQLQMPAVIQKIAQAHNGLILVTGPTGSGKSTTLAAMLDFINKQRSGHIMTVEDPVEFVHHSKRCLISHREVGRDVPSFQDAIRSASREDVDVLLIGELRQAVTMGLALQAASSGTLVFATIHTNSAPATIDRIINAFHAEDQPAIRGMLAECLTAIVAQQLIKTADGKGRLAVQEVLLGNKAVSAIIREGKNRMLSSLIQSSGNEGMQSMDAILEKLVKQKQITAEDALMKAIDKESFTKMLQGAF